MLIKNSAVKYQLTKPLQKQKLDKNIALLYNIWDFFEKGGYMNPVLDKKPHEVEVYDHSGCLVSLALLKKHDLLLVYFVNRSKGSMSTEAIVSFNVQGTDLHFTLIQFEKFDSRGLTGRQASWETGLNPLFFPWRKIEKIQMAGNDPTGRVLMFVRELFAQKVKAERAAEKMRANIDALKA